MIFKLQIIILFIFQLSFSQRVYEYVRLQNVDFTVYNNEKLYNVKNTSNNNTVTPEKLAQNYFFAKRNDDLYSLFIDREATAEKSNSHFDNIKKLREQDAYIQILHKLSFEYNDENRCYIMFIGKIKDVSFPFPTLLSLVNRNNNWFIENLPNQKYIIDCLTFFKSCVLSNLISGKANSKEVSKLIKDTRSSSGHLDFFKLYKKLIEIQSNPTLKNKLTFAKDMNCKEITFNPNVKNKTIWRNILENVTLSKFQEKLSNQSSNLKFNKTSDSIKLLSLLKFKHNSQNYEIFKYKSYEKGEEVFRISDINRDIFEKTSPYYHLVFLFQNLKTDFILNLSPNMNEEKNQENNLIYKKTRGLYEIMNITKLYDLFIQEKELFEEYLE